MKNYCTLLFFILVFLFVGCSVDNSIKSIGPKYNYNFTIENKSDGTGLPLSESGEVTLNSAQTLSIYSIKRSAEGSFLENTEVQWSSHGGAGTLTISPNGKSAIFTATSTGTSIVKVSVQNKIIQLNIIVTEDPSNFLITGVTGGSDAIEDSRLTDGLLPTVNWNDTTYEGNYQITLYEDDGTTVACAQVSIAADITSHTFSSCSLTRGQVYKAKVVARAGVGSNDVDATNNFYEFIVTPQLSISDLTVSEAIGTGSFTVSLSDVSDYDISFDWLTIGGTAVSTPAAIKDFDAVASTTVTILAGQMSINLDVTLINDLFDEDDQSFNLSISNSNFASFTQALATITLQDNDNPPSVSISDDSALEGSTLSFLLTRSERSEKEIQLSYTTSDSVAINGSDYTASPGILTIPAGDDLTIIHSINIISLNDVVTCESPKEDFNISLNSPLNATFGTSTAKGYVKDADLPKISISQPTVTEGSNLIFNVSLDFTCTGKTVSFDWSTVDSTATGDIDYIRTSGTVSLADPATTTSFSVTTIDDTHAEIAEEKFFIISNNITNALFSGSANSIGTIQDSEGGNGVAKMAVGSNFTCALSTIGDVKCWGKNSKGNLGKDGFHVGDQANEMGDNLPFVNLGSGGLKVQKIARGKDHACVVLVDGRVKCWGDNRYGELGLGDTEDRGENSNEMGDNLPFVQLGTDLIATDIATAGGPISCVIVEDTNDGSDTGKVKCWGGDWRGIGYGSLKGIGNAANEMGDNFGFIDLGVGRTAKSIIGRNYGMCVITDEDKVKCWGSSVGDDLSEMGDNLAYMDFGTDRTVKYLSHGFYASCAILDNDQVKCWGPNNFGQLGQGDIDDYVLGDSTPEIDLGTNKSALKVTSGYRHNCALLNDNTVKCWGQNSSGSLGYPSGGHRGDGPNEMGENLPIVDFGGQTVVDIQSAGFHTCAVLSDNNVKCWGQNGHGATGQGNTASVSDPSAVPAIDLGTDLKATSLAVGSWNDGGSGQGYYNCVIIDDIVDDSDDGKLKCWGGNFNGHLGHSPKVLGDGLDKFDNVADEMGANLTIIDLGPGRTAVDLQTSNDIICAILDNNDLVCWGNSGGSGSSRFNPNNSDRGISPNQMGDSLASVDFGIGKHPISFAITSGWQNAACAIMNDFTTKCWGTTSSGANGNAGAYINPQAGDTMPTLDLGSDIYATKIVGKDFGFCALMNNKKIKCWGNGVGDNVGELGDNLAYIDLGTGIEAIDLAAGAHHICAVLDDTIDDSDDGKVKCWGDAGYGQLGTGNTTDIAAGSVAMGDALLPIDLGPSTTVKTIFSGNQSHSTCAVLTDDNLKCWGRNNYGQLGLGTTETMGDDANEMAGFLNPIDLGTELGSPLIPVQGTISGSHACAILNNGNLKCWGHNKYGQLGINSITSKGDGSTGSEMGDLLIFVDHGF